MEVLHLAGALIEHFLEGSARLHYGFGMLTQKRRLVFVTLLIWVNVLTEQFFQGNVALSHFPNKETLFMS